MLNPFDIIIFGGGGDLALRKLLPAMYRAYQEGNLPEGSRILPTVREETQRAEYIETAHKALKEFLAKDEFNAKDWKAFATFLVPVVSNVTAPDDNWDVLKGILDEHDSTKSRVFYLSLPPAVYGTCCEILSVKNLITPTSRVVVEKPIGYCGESAEAINGKIAEYFSEEQIFRIDHYLGKETVQNLMALRFSNSLFENMWDAKSIDNIQISISETVGLETRAGFYDKAGALRDMVQNHLLQLLCLVAMESPHKLNANSIRNEKLKVLEALRPLIGSDVDKNIIRGQYVPGDLNGKIVPGYLEELNEGSSKTETFVGIRAHIDNWRWAGVPFYLRTGKRMAKRCAEIVVQYKKVSHNVYEDSVGEIEPNRLVIRLQPEETIQLTLMSKRLDNLEMQLEPVTMNIELSQAYSNGFHSDAYKRLMLDAAANNPSLFIHRDEVRQAWKWIDPIIDRWQEKGKPALYRAGSWGPEDADELLAENNHVWFNTGDKGA
ncbi:MULTISPECIES: glucose-6-phosphate dehydrogenase [Pseudoalteromonas]|uniref:Glucose-6-phosphate 1-dehydrogenase n=4 Tax=Pseudoalteromonas TaxID=53246 RepID=Q3IKH3_PSET1|nr:MULTISPECIES: glucose-6-phosphate dehydrogenase [Pseudoalteromonas]ALS32560.1 glucose-6-phosphate 1-dehydrogenase [Pseudoalteromonas translucida KMM 520]ASM53573.1 glucose-6-phosphate 1-dehydrogenase [Pseudoalteromonas nigrifaciens]MBB1369919.1 glucose-6-phosphate dehydrogenase [Pseudoalteromonas sp. SR45-4]MBB1404151.1 glucose-6-phosphate dehydrogenase [Pseudoalteromonas sp. SG44-5]MBH0073390.1 glucose-6-phosphate dehydrogenase [Pseudoalteromonas sp. NZS127]|tara:strand:- start:7747 stop:9222 length:1476 start_codon:yes stop_codon:yes gene_type:complete